MKPQNGSSVDGSGSNKMDLLNTKYAEFIFKRICSPFGTLVLGHSQLILLLSISDPFRHWFFRFCVRMQGRNLISGCPSYNCQTGKSLGLQGKTLCTSTTYEVWRIVSVDEKHPKLPGAGTSTVAITRYHSGKTSSTDRWQISSPSYGDDVKLRYYLNHPRLLRSKWWKRPISRNCPRTYLLFRTQSSPMPSSPSHPNLERISNFHHLTISTSNKSSRRIHLKVKLVFFNTKKNGFKSKIHGILGKKKFPTQMGFLLDVFFLGRRWLRPWEVTEFLVLLGTTWTKALGVIDHPKLINSNTEYDTIIVHTYRIYTYSIHIYKHIF